MKLLEMVGLRPSNPAGTRLELAQLFADLGDPDLARNYLHEVLDEGNDDEKETAQSLIVELPEPVLE